MRLPRSAVRVLVLLLVLRVVFAPVTVRPHKTGGHGSRIVVSMRVGWPLQRLARFSASSKLAVLYQGKHREMHHAPGRWLTRPDDAPTVSASLAARASTRAPSYLLDRSTSALRC